MAIDARREDLEERVDVLLQPDALAHLGEVLLPHAPVLRVVQEQVGQLPALLHEVGAREPVDLVLEPRPAEQLDLPLDIRGTAFQAQVWRALQKIPPGQTTTYTAIAAALGTGMPSSADSSAEGTSGTTSRMCTPSLSWTTRRQTNSNSEPTSTPIPIQKSVQVP